MKSGTRERPERPDGRALAVVTACRPATEDDILDTLDDAIALAEVGPDSAVKEVLARVSQRAAHRSGQMQAVRLPASQGASQGASQDAPIRR